MKKKYNKVFEGYVKFIEGIKLNLESNDGFIKIKNNKLLKVKDHQNKAFLSMAKEHSTKTFELARHQALIGEEIIKEMVVNKKSGSDRAIGYKTVDDGIIAIIEEYENHLYNQFKPFLENL